jgi:uroporphyrin-III C-methyltransferase/precorrin-2 dehydrogenase/sirohydrochlorin ferrochelatase
MLPVFLKLTGRRVLVVGAGPMAAAKIATLSGAGALITVVAPVISPAVAEAGHRNDVRIRRRRFQAGDLTGVWLVIAAAPPRVNRAVARAAERRRVFVNAVDDPDNASAYLGGVIRRSGVTVAVSTSGRAPALAGLLREGIDALLPADLDRWLRRADRLRAGWRRTRRPMTQRRPELLRALAQLYGRRRERRTEHS